MDNYVIDRTRLSDEQNKLFDDLIAKAMVDPKAAQEEMEEQVPPVTPPKKKPTEEEIEVTETKKNAPEMSPELKAAMDELADLKKSYEMDKMIEVAKKYAPLGKKEDELAKTLYDMKKSNPANYDAYIAILDESLGFVEKSGVFAEIGKSGSRGSSVAGGSVEDKIDAKAREIMKAAPDMNYTDAVAKAWIDNPELMDEYDAEYFG